MPPPTVPAATSAPPPQATSAPVASQATSAPAPNTLVPPPTSGDAIAFSGLDWTSARVQTRIAQYIVEHGYGYATSAVSGGTDRLFQSLREGDIQVSMEIWLPLQESGWNQARSEGDVEYIGASMDKDWQSTFVIPSYLQEEYPGLDHVDDLKDPRYQELFATASSDGKARLFTCAVGWACQEINDAQIEGYELTGHLQVVRPDSEQVLFDGLYRLTQSANPGLAICGELPTRPFCWTSFSWRKHPTAMSAGSPTGPAPSKTHNSHRRPLRPAQPNAGDL